MSEYNSGSPVFTPVSPEDEAAYHLEQARLAKVAGSVVPGAWASMLAPRSTDKEGVAHWALPGVLPATYAFLGGSLPEFANWAGHKAGYNLNIPTAPGVEAARTMEAGNERWAKEAFPPVNAETPMEERIQDVASGAASLALPIPGANMIKGASTLARVARTGLEAAVPGAGLSAKGAVLGGAGTAAIGAVQEAEHDAFIRKLGYDPETMEPLPPSTATPSVTAPAPAQNIHLPIEGVASYDQSASLNPGDLSQGDTTATVVHPETGAPVNVPFPTGSTAIPYETTPLPAATTAADEKYETGALFGRPDVKFTTPDFGRETDVPWGVGAAAGFGGLATVILGMRYGGKFLNQAVRTITGEGDQINTIKNVAEFNRNLNEIDRGNVINKMDPNATGATRGEAPLPGKAGTIGTKASQQLIDQNRMLMEFAKENAPTSGIAKQFEAEIGTTNNFAPLSNRIAAMAETGVNLGNGGSPIPKLNEMLRDRARLTPEQAAVFEKGMSAGDELDTRMKKFNQAIANGTSLADEDLRHNWTTTHSDDLRAAYADMMNDPVLANLATRFNQLQNVNMLQARDMGRISAADVAKTLGDRPRQVPSTNPSGEVERALGERNIDTRGWESPPTTPTDAIVQHYFKLYAELEQNTLYHKILEHADRYQQANPGAARVVTLLKDANGKLIPPPEGTLQGRKIITYDKGVPHVWEIDNTDLHTALKGNVTKTGAFLNTADILRRGYQGGTTGVAATLIAQRPFAYTNLLRIAPQIGVDRFAGTSFGQMGRLLHYVSDGKLGLRTGLDPTQLIQAFYEGHKGAAAVMGHAMSKLLADANHPAATGLTALLGNKWTASFQKWLEHKWETSNAMQRRAEGVSGMGTGGTYDRPLYNRAYPTRRGYSAIASEMQNIYMPDGIHLPYTKIGIPGTKGIAKAYLNMRSLLREVHQEISEGANSAYYEQMKKDPNISREQRVYYARRVVGDPSVHGASNLAQQATHLIPWINPTIQDTARMMHNLRDHPVSYTLGMVHTLTMQAAASVMSAMLGGNKHINMLGRLMTAHDRASNVTIFHDPDNEHNYTQVNLPQRWRGPYAYILEGVANGVGAFNYRQGEDGYNRVLHSLTDMFSHHVSHSTTEGVVHGALDTFDIAQPPPILQVPIATAGGRLNSPAATIADNLMQDKPVLEGMISQSGKAHRLPGQATGGTLTAGDDAKWLRGVLENVAGVAGGAFLDHIRTAGARYGMTHDIADTFSGYLSDAGHLWRDNAGWGNSLWGNNVKLQVRNPMAEYNDQAWQRMTHMPSATDVQLGGLTRRGGTPIGMGEPAINSDPRIVQMVKAVNDYHGQIARRIEPHIQDLKRQIDSLNSNPQWSATDKREQLTKLVTEKNGLESAKNQEIEKLNAALSWITGGKTVNVMTFDPKKGMDQFHD